MQHDLRHRVGASRRPRPWSILPLPVNLGILLVSAVAAAVVLTTVAPTANGSSLLGPAHNAISDTKAVLPTTTTSSAPRGGAAGTSSSSTGPSKTSAGPSKTSSGPAPSPAGFTSSPNLLSAGQSALSGNTGGWIGLGGTLTWVASPSTTGKGALELVASSTNSPAIASGSPQAGGLTPASAGSVYQGTAIFEAAGTSQPVQGLLAFFDGSGNTLDVVWGEADVVPTSQWLTLAPTVAIAPPGTVSVGLGFVMRSSTTGAALYMDQPVLQSAPGGGSPSEVGPLRTSGNAILDGQGHKVVLQGVNAFGLQASDDPAVLSEAQIVQAKQWGANMVRIALGEQLWLTSSCTYDPKYEAAVDEMVNWVTSLGMVALLDLHFNQIGSGCPAAGPEVMADYPGSVDFWQQVASHYASNPLVAFDLYNEPHNISDSVWLNGGTVTTGQGITFQAAGMQQLYDAVRSTGATNLVVVSGNNWANEVPTQLVQGTNIAYAVHAYTCTQPWQVPPQCTTPNPYDPSSILQPWVAFGHTEPVLVTEFGWPNPDSGTYIRNVIAFAQAQGWGWSPFIWYGTTSSPWSLVAQMPASGPFEPMPSGMPVLAAFSGLPLG